MGKNRYKTPPVYGAQVRGPRQAGFEDIVRRPERYSTRIRFRTALKAPSSFKYSTDLLRGRLEVCLRRGDPAQFRALVQAVFPDGTLDGFEIFISGLRE